MSLCERCRYAMWDYEEYYSGKSCGMAGDTRQYFIYNCDKIDKLTDRELNDFNENKVEECEQYAYQEVDY